MKNSNSFTDFLALILKGMGMGAANVIPGVSGGTIALITGIFEPLIDALKSFNAQAIKLLFSGKWKEFAEHIKLRFLIGVFSGIAISILTLAKLLDYLFENFPVLVWAFFFGLIIASVYSVGRTISRWNTSVWISFITGTAVALAIALFKPAQENNQLYYLFICGIVAICSMILPGLSGSFVLVLMGNYQLVMIDAVNNLDLGIILPVGLGAIIGLLAFSHLLSWILKKYKNQTISSLTGFMLGSLLILWPWKEAVYSMDSSGNPLISRSGELLEEGYTYLLPQFSDIQTWIALSCILVGIISILGIEYFAKAKTQPN